jgi:hypothetical protein
MRDLSDARWIKLKGILFLTLGAGLWLILVRSYPSVRFAVLLTLAIWCFCRFYYFAFYVIEHYVDPSFRFSGLLAFSKYMLKRKKGATESRL